MMTAVQAIVLGAVQGVTEFLPISSSGHLIIFPELLGWEPQGLTFDVGIHLATTIAIIAVFNKEIRHLYKGVVQGSKEARTLASKLAIGTVPAIIFGAFFGDFLEGTRSLAVVAIMLIAWGALLGLADYLARQRKVGTDVGVSWWQTIMIGSAQALALIPGTSRSGATMAVGMLAGLDHNNAARFSFLLAIPATLAAAVKTFIDAAQAGWDVPMDMLGLGFLSALGFGILAIRLLFFIIKRKWFMGFAIYRIALGMFLLYVVMSQYAGV